MIEFDGSKKFFKSKMFKKHVFFKQKKQNLTKNLKISTSNFETKKFLPPPRTAIPKMFQYYLNTLKGTSKYSSTYFKTFMVIWSLNFLKFEKEIPKSAKKGNFSNIFTPPCRNTHILSHIAQDVGNLNFRQNHALPLSYRSDWVNL